MNFLSPWFAAAVAAVVVPALLILYFLKLRRRPEVVPSTLLWRRAVQDLQVNAPFQRLRRNLLLLIQLLILAAAVTALARPIIETTVADEQRVVILIDRSASMNVEEDGQTRLEQAKQEAIRLVKTFNQRSRGWRSFLSFSGAGAETQVMVIAFSDKATIVSPYTTNTAGLVDLIRRIEPSDGRTELREALKLAEGYRAPPTRLTPDMEPARSEDGESAAAGGGAPSPPSAEAPARLVLISDGRVANLHQLILRSGTMELRRIGDRSDNVGITMLSTERNYERPEYVNVFLTVQNFGPQPVQTDVSIYVDGELKTVEPLSLSGRGQPAPEDAAESAAPPDDQPSGGIRALSFDLPLDKAGLISARLADADALEADNTAWAAVPPPRRQRVLVVTKGNVFLNSVLGGLPLLEYPFVTPQQYQSGVGGPYQREGQSTYDVVIFDRVQPPADLPAGNYLLLGAVPELPGFEVLEPMETSEPHALIWWDETHPVLRHVALDYVYVAESMQIRIPESAEVLIEGPSNNPVLVRYAQQGRHYVALTFAIENSTWWSKPSFPVFMYNVIRYLGGGTGEDERNLLQPGDTLAVPFPAGVDRLELTGPHDLRAALTRDPSGVGYFAGTDRVGVYRAADGVAGRDQFAVNLVDEWESEIKPAGELRLGAGPPVTEVATIRTATPEVWRWFIGAALALLLLEWWIYNRRVMI